MSDATMNLYELNKIAYNKLPVLAIHTAAWSKKIDQLVSDIKQDDNSYFMLLNNDIHYYTLFRLTENSNETFLEAITDCISAIGDLIDIEYNQETNTHELWFKKNGEVLMFVFFGYDKGVIECHS